MPYAFDWTTMSRWQPLGDEIAIRWQLLLLSFGLFTLGFRNTGVLSVWLPISLFGMLMAFYLPVRRFSGVSVWTAWVLSVIAVLSLPLVLGGVFGVAWLPLLTLEPLIERSPLPPTYGIGGGERAAVLYAIPAIVLSVVITARALFRRSRSIDKSFPALEIASVVSVIGYSVMVLAAYFGHSAEVAAADELGCHDGTASIVTFSLTLPLIAAGAAIPYAAIAAALRRRREAAQAPVNSSEGGGLLWATLWVGILANVAGVVTLLIGLVVFSDAYAGYALIVGFGSPCALVGSVLFTAATLKQAGDKRAYSAGVVGLILSVTAAPIWLVISFIARGNVFA